ncbi:MAG: hypothetical protein JG776_901 [Caloramator sp.]|jgi:hypothetical protein|uniref:Uncharacterized protein n=1 Tax=Caloramator proteoclasticus DSM 10124 TaxID=1121262 RepID=A0A1M4YZ38_9CLOT|nr:MULTISPECIES: hypothetical protein [Caloramator]MBZ4663199.1 hypothetical protein [Caloramator sp.]SHF10817.1 hypothetical protein SAMN02746091_01782 [Caloramator proteoclasticus DSM 10124]
MKLLREKANVLVLFQDTIMNPIMIMCSMGVFKVNRVININKERRYLRDCYIFLCSVEGRDEPIELRWDIEGNIWFLEKF